MQNMSEAETIHYRNKWCHGCHFPGTEKQYNIYETNNPKCLIPDTAMDNLELEYNGSVC